jgi:hypothetical protein
MAKPTLKVVNKGDREPVPAQGPSTADLLKELENRFERQKLDPNGALAS